MINVTFWKCPLQIEYLYVWSLIYRLINGITLIAYNIQHICIFCRFMTNIWAMFAVVFLAIYTANLAAFMITREEYYDFMGIDDYRVTILFSTLHDFRYIKDMTANYHLTCYFQLSKPHSHKPMFKFGTVPHSHIDSTIHKYFPEMFNYMKNYNRNTVTDGLNSLLTA